MSVLKLPIAIIRKIDHRCRSFLWNSLGNGGKVKHLVSWDVVCRPKSLGGLGIKSLKTQNNALLMKWWFKLFNDVGRPWRSLILQIYYTSTTPGDPQLRCMKIASPFWKSVLQTKELAQLFSGIHIGDGWLISFWHDTWTGIIFGQTLPPPLHVCTSKLWIDPSFSQHSKLGYSL